MPSVKELATLVDYRVTHPAIDEDVFPNTPNNNMWSSTPDARDPQYAWVVDFAYGSVGHVTKGTALQVRCVK